MRASEWRMRAIRLLGRVGLPALLCAALLAGCADEDSSRGRAPAVTSTRAAVAGAPVVSTPPVTATPMAVRYLCDGGKTFEARVFLKPLERAIVIVDGRTLDLPQVRSASGIRYSDGVLVYHAKGDNAFIEDSGVMTYVNCHAQ